MKKIISTFLTVMVTLSAIPIPFSSVSAEEVPFDTLKTGIARILLYSDRAEGDFELEGLGTGFFIDHETVVTAAHVVVPRGTDKPSPYIKIGIEDDTFKDHEIGAFGKVVAVDIANDLAVVKVTPMPFDKKELRQNFQGHYEFSVAGQEPGISEGVRIVGYPDITNGEISMTSGIISSLDDSADGTVFFSDVQASFGNSGGPAINEDNEVVGVVSQIASSRTNNSQLTRIVSMSDHLDWIKAQQAQTIGVNDISVDFYNHSKERHDSAVLDAPTTVMHTVSSSYYPEFTFELPQGYDALGEGRNYIIRDTQDDIESIITTVPLPETPAVDDLIGIAANFQNIDINYSTIQENVTLAGLMGVKFEETDTRQIYYVLSHENSIIFISGSTASKSIQTLSFSSNSLVRFDPNSFNSHAHDYFIQASKDYYLYDDDQGGVNVYRRTSVYEETAYFYPVLGTSYEELITSIADDYNSDPDFASYIIESEERIQNKNGVNYYWFNIYSIQEQYNILMVVFENKKSPEDSYLFVSSSENIRYTFPVASVIASSFKTSSQIALQTFNVKTELDNQNRIDGVTNSPVTSNPTPAPTQTSDPTMAREDLKGYILLQVEQHGEAWYINPQTRKRIYMKDGKAAFALMRTLGLGITNVDLNKFAIGTTSKDSNTCNTFRSSLKGRVLLQVEENGEAWYIYPKNCRRYSLGRPDEAYEIMRTLGLGAITSDITVIGEESL